MNTYAGIGSRETPKDILELMTRIANFLGERGYTLNSGGATGADEAFRIGANNKNIFLPWKGYNKIASYHTTVPQQAIDIAEAFHPNWDACNDAVRKLHGRNAQIVLGSRLNEPVEFVICWTPDGKASGGTGLAIRMAQELDIPVFNLKNQAELDSILEVING